MRQVLFGLSAIVGMLAFMGVGLSATGDKWDVDLKNSEISFSLSVAGQKVVGRVQSFESDITFNAEKPDTTDVVITLDMASFTVGNPDGDAALKEKEWFDIASHPTGQFVAKSFASSDTQSFELKGSLSLRGVSKDVSLPVTLKIDGNRADAEGSVTLNRNDFGVGTNADTGPISVGEEVTIKIKIVATRAG